MPRTNPTEVRSIMNQHPVPLGQDISYFITTANVMLNELVPSGTYSESYLGVMETWLAAFLVRIDQRKKERVQAGPSEDEYDPVKEGQGFHANQYGEVLLLMDNQSVLERVLIKTYFAAKRWE